MSLEESLGFSNRVGEKRGESGKHEARVEEVGVYPLVRGIPSEKGGWYGDGDGGLRQEGGECDQERGGSSVWCGQIPFRIADLPPAIRPLTASLTQKFTTHFYRSHLPLFHPSTFFFSKVEYEIPSGRDFFSPENKDLAANLRLEATYLKLRIN